MKNISVKLTVLLVLILFVSLKASAAYISFAFTNSLGAPITNDFRLVKVGDTLSDGSVIPQGLPIRVTPSSDGRATNRLQTGNWYATNSYLSQAIKFRVPQDDGPTVYFFTDPGIWVSGGSYFVTQVIGGSNASPTYNQVTNALGYLPLTQSKLDDTNSALIARIIATNGLNMAATVTNIGGAATNLTVKASGGAGSKAISAKDVLGAEQMFVDDEGLWLPQMISSSGLQLVGINDSGLLSKFTGTLTNNTSGNSSLATNAINATNIYGAGLTLITNAATTVAGNATNNLNTALVTRIANSTNDLNTTLGTRIIATNDLLVTRITAATNGATSVLNTRIQNATNDLNTALVAADTVVSNGLSARIVAANAALATRMDDATNSLNTTISTKITNATNSLNSALVTRIQNATNDLNTALVAANAVVSNGLSARLIATNAALISADTVVSNGLSARLIATNNSLQTQILNATNGLNSALVTKITDATNSLNSALVTAGTTISNGLSSRLIATNVALLANDTTVSNGLSARIIATNSLLTTRISDATNSLNTVLVSQISATTNDYKVRVIAAGTNITVLTNATAGIYTVSGSFDSNSVYAIGLQAAYTVGGATGGVTVATANTLAQTNIAWRVPNMLLSGTNLFPGAAVTGTLTNNTTGNAAGATNAPDGQPLRTASLKTLIGNGSYSGSKYVSGTNVTGAGQQYLWTSATANIGDLVVTNDFNLVDAILTNSAAYAQDNSSLRVSNSYGGKSLTLKSIKAYNQYRGIYLKPDTDYFYNFLISDSTIIAPFTSLEAWYGYGTIDNCIIIATNGGSELGASVTIVANDDSQFEISGSRLIYGQSDFSGGLLAYARAKVKFRNTIFESKDYPTNTSAIYLAEGHTAHPTSVTVEDSMFIHKGAPVICVSPLALSETDSYRVDFKNVILNPTTNGVVIWNTNFIVRVWGGNLVPGNFANRSNVIWDGYWGEFKTNAISLGIPYTNTIAPTLNSVSWLFYGDSAADYLQVDLLVDFDGNNTWDLTDPRIMTDVSTTTFIPVLNAAWTWPLNVGSRWMLSTNNTLLDSGSVLHEQFGAYWRVAK